MTVKFSGFFIHIEAIFQLLLHNLHDCTFKSSGFSKTITAFIFFIIFNIQDIFNSYVILFTIGGSRRPSNIQYVACFCEIIFKLAAVNNYEKMFNLKLFVGVLNPTHLAILYENSILRRSVFSVSFLLLVDAIRPII